MSATEELEPPSATTLGSKRAQEDAERIAELLASLANAKAEASLAKTEAEEHAQESAGLAAELEKLRKQLCQADEPKSEGKLVGGGKVGVQRVSSGTTAASSPGGQSASSSPLQRRKDFKPQVAIYDIMDPNKGLRRIVRIEAPGRCLEDGSSTLEGSVQAIRGGVSIRLTKQPDIPADAEFCSPWEVDDPVGTWTWDYAPNDGAWELCESWGLAHGVFAFALSEAVSGSTSKQLARPESPQRPQPKSCWTRSSIALPPPPASEPPRSFVAVIAPVSTSKRSCCFFRRETVFLGVGGNRIDGDSIAAGALLLGPQGPVEVRQSSVEPARHREVASLNMGGEVLSVLVGTKVASVALTECGGAASDWAYYDVRELQAGSHEVGVCSPGGHESTAPLQSYALLGQQTATLALEINFSGKHRSVFVMVEKCVQGHMCRSIKNPTRTTKSTWTANGPFTATQVKYTSPEQRRMYSKGSRWK